VNLISSKIKLKNS